MRLFLKKIKCREIILLDSTTWVNMNAEEKEKCFCIFLIESQSLGAG